jgi:hypothetical protein
MRLIRFLHSVAFAVGMTVALNGTILLLTERIVIYPNERSLPLLQLNRVEQTAFQTLQQVPGMKPRHSLVSSDSMGIGLVIAGSLLCLLAGGGMWQHTSNPAR